MSVHTETETNSITITVVTVPGHEYDRMKMVIRWLFILAAVSVVFGIIVAPFFGWTFSTIGVVLAGMAYLYHHWAEQRLSRKYGWDGVSYPLKIVPEYQTVLHE